jgi:alkylated DNA repair dioxygenase AlkB
MDSPEVTLTPSFLTPDDATKLFLALTESIAWDERMKARKTACFGQTYDDSGVDYEVIRMHPLLVPLCSRIEEHLGFRPTNCLLNYYADGRSSMGFHSDAIHNLHEGTGVAIISLGAERTLSFRSKVDVSQLGYSMPHGSLLYMTQETQNHWTHAVKKQDTDDARISLTFRYILTPDELAAKQAA